MTSCTLDLETWAIASGNQCRTQETEGGGEEAKVEAYACDKEASIIDAFLIEKVNGYEAHEFKEMTK